MYGYVVVGGGSAGRTCATGGSEGSVVDLHLKIRGVTGLRVADASAMSRIISGNTHAPSIMIGKRYADFILNPPVAKAAPVTATAPAPAKTVEPAE